VLDRLQHASQLLSRHVEPVERGGLDLRELGLEAQAKIAFGRVGSHWGSILSDRLPGCYRLVNAW
jgi:hypothetical protein